MANAVIRSTPVRLSLLLGAAFLLALTVSGFVAFTLVRQELAARTDRSISDTFKMVATTYFDSDASEPAELIDSHTAPAIGSEQVYMLQDHARNRLAGSVTLPSVADGWSTVRPQTVNGDEADSDYRFYSGTVADYRLTIGASLEPNDELAAVMLATLAWAGAGLALLVAVMGTFVAIRGQQRLDRISATMAEIGRGNLRARIAVNARDNDVNRIGRDVNMALDRLAALVEGMRQVSVDMAHELKTPLNRLGIAVDTAIQSNQHGDDVGPLLERVQAEGRKLNATFIALLRIAQIEAGARRSRFTDLDLAPILETIAEDYRPVAAQRRQDLSLSVTAPLAWVHGDAELLTQLLANLVENAIRHCPSDTSIRLTAWSVQGKTTVTVADTGPGIPEAAREKVFDRLYRLEKSRTTPGSGLGLSLVKAVTELHGARIVLSDNAPGLTVTIAIPMIRPGNRFA